MNRAVNFNEEIFNRHKSIQSKLDFDIVIIGGGPSTLSYLCYLFKTNTDNFILDKKILIIEKSESFGSGCLGKYGINSNTSAEGFLRLICFNNNENDAKNYETALSPNKDTIRDILKNNKSLKNNQNNIKLNNYLTIIPIFKDFYSSSPSVKKLIQKGVSSCPLNLIGEYMQSLGNYLMNMISLKFSKNILLINTEVVSIYEKKSPSLSYELIIKKLNDIRTISTKIIVFASGAIPRKNLELQNNFLNSQKFSENKLFFNSDQFLQQEYFIKGCNLLKSIDFKMQEPIISKKKVVIIGGSHSGFSCAWILLNGYSSTQTSFDRNSEVTSRFNLNQCRYCLDMQTDICNCFGKIKSLKWPDYKFEALDNLEIYIIYRDNIKVYFSSEKEAELHGYSDYEKEKAVNKNSNVYPFIGLRGNAKELYLNIVGNSEKRVKLIKSYKDNYKVIDKIINDSNLCIYAGGYSTNLIPIYSSNNKEKINFFFEGNSLNKGTCEVNNKLNILDSFKTPIKNVFGIGQGYATNSIELCENGLNGKANSINLYNTIIAKKLNKSLKTSLSIIYNIKKEPIRFSKQKTNKDLSILNTSKKLLSIKNFNLLKEKEHKNNFKKSLKIVDISKNKEFKSINVKISNKSKLNNSKVKIKQKNTLKAKNKKDKSTDKCFENTKNFNCILIKDYKKRLSFKNNVVIKKENVKDKNSSVIKYYAFEEARKNKINFLKQRKLSLSNNVISQNTISSNLQKYTTSSITTNNLNNPNSKYNNSINKNYINSENKKSIFIKDSPIYNKNKLPNIHVIKKININNKL